MKWIGVFAVIISLLGCGTWKPGGETRIQSDLVAREYNDLRDQYAARPTFVSLRERVGGTPILQITVDLYGPDDGDLWLTDEAAEDLIPKVDKYLEWEEIARSRGDQISKDIGKVRSAAGLSYMASLHSGNSEAHFFVVGECLAGCRAGVSEHRRFYFDRGNTIKLKQLLQRFSSGEIESLDTDSIYK